MTTIYLASSWRNEAQPHVLAALRRAGHAVYDFRNPDDSWTATTSGDDSGGFHWSDIDADWQNWDPQSYANALETDVAQLGFARDFEAMERAKVGVLLLPSGRSAHLEAGYFAGHPEKHLHIFAPQVPEPELMYLMADGLHLSLGSLLAELD